MINLTGNSVELMKRKAKFATFVTLFTLVLLLVPASAVFAHSPLFPEENHDPSHAYQINGSVTK